MGEGGIGSTHSSLSDSRPRWSFRLGGDNGGGQIFYPNALTRFGQTPIYAIITALQNGEFFGGFYLGSRGKGRSKMIYITRISKLLKRPQVLAARTFFFIFAVAHLVLLISDTVGPRQVLGTEIGNFSDEEFLDENWVSET